MSHLFRKLSLIKRKTNVTSTTDCILTFKCFQVIEYFFLRHYMVPGSLIPVSKAQHSETWGKCRKGPFFWLFQETLILSLLEMWFPDKLMKWRFNYSLKICVYSVFHSQVICLFLKDSLLLLNNLLFKVGVLSYWLTWLQWSNLNNGCLF